MRIVADSKIPFVREAFGQFAEVVLLDTVDIAKTTVRNAEILLVRSETKVDRALLDGSDVRFVGTATIGTDHIDTDYLAARGIRFSSAPGSNANSVAEYVVAALLFLSKRLRVELRDKVLGVIGVGNVGSKVVRYAEALGMRVLQNDPPLARQTGLTRFLQLDELMESDILTLHVPLTMKGPDATFHLFDRDRISGTKKGSILINTSRGAVIDTEGLKAALGRQHIGACVLDVWEGEPAIDVNLLKMVDLGTPHISGYSFDGKVIGTRMLYESICRFTGQQATWDPRGQLSSVGSFSLTTNNSPLESILYDAVRHCYDIEVDDRNLRGIISLPDDERGAFFRGLRSHYPIRREFCNFNLSLESSDRSQGEILRKLGFVVEYRECG